MDSQLEWVGRVVQGAGGASLAFKEENERRITELAALVGYRPYPGTLNVRLVAAFAWTADRIRGEILHRAPSPEVWEPRGVNLFPVKIREQHRHDWVPCPCHVIRFDGATYPPALIGIIAPCRLREEVESGDVVVGLDAWEGLDLLADAEEHAHGA